MPSTFGGSEGLLEAEPGFVPLFWKSYRVVLNLTLEHDISCFEPLECVYFKSKLQIIINKPSYRKYRENLLLRWGGEGGSRIRAGSGEGVTGGGV